MSNFDLFRTKMGYSENCRLTYESSFITEGTSAVIIHVLRLNDDKQAALIMTDKEGPDTTYVFTYKGTLPHNELLKSDYFCFFIVTTTISLVSILSITSFISSKVILSYISFKLGINFL